MNVATVVASRFAGALAALASSLALAMPPLPAAAEQTATIRGVVFDCDTHQPLANVPVQLVSTDGTVSLRTDRQGRFIRLGMTPGAWRITALVPILPDGKHPSDAIRYAVLEPGDIVDVPMGVFHDWLMHVDAACQWRRVPAQESPNLRYTLH